MLQLPHLGLVHPHVVRVNPKRVGVFPLGVTLGCPCLQVGHQLAIHEPHALGLLRPQEEVDGAAQQVGDRNELGGLRLALSGEPRVPGVLRDAEMLVAGSRSEARRVSERTKSRPERFPGQI